MQVKKVALHGLTCGDYLRKGILAWLTAAAVEFCLFPVSLSGVSSLSQMSFLRFCLIAFIAFSGIIFLPLRPKAERYALLAPVLCLSACALWRNFTWPLLAVCVLLVGCFAVFAHWGREKEQQVEAKLQPAQKRYGVIVAVAATVFFLVVSAWTVCRVWAFSTPTFDFGIFSQMFYNMKISGLPMTTVERDGLLSHFAVHVSPIYYLMLPFYVLFPYPVTLQILQAAVMASAVIPLWLIGKRHGLSGGMRAILCGVLLAMPAFAGGAGYDLHENAFLTPLLLWLFYAVDTKNSWLIIAFALLTLLVKEDAAVYVAVVGIYLILRSGLQKDKDGIFWGLGLLGASIIYFFAVTWYLSAAGDGVMTYRYQNFMTDRDGSLLSVIKAVLLCPMKAVYECVDAEKLQYIALTLLPLLGMPLLTRKYERFVLLIPYILVNLMSDYTYQHSIFFQYNFGSLAFLIYMTARNLADLKWTRVRYVAASLALIVSVCCFGGQILPKAKAAVNHYTDYRGYYSQVQQALDRIPDGASVSATTFYTTYLSQREILYDVRYAKEEHILSTEYVALNMRSAGDYEKYATGSRNGFEVFTELLEENGYRVIYQWEDRIVIYQKDQMQ